MSEGIKKSPLNDHENIGGVKNRVRCWICGFATEMRKKSHGTVQKWVDSISSSATDENETPTKENINCDNSELCANEEGASSSASGVSVKGKISEICNKLSVHEKLKSKKIQEFKNLLAKTTQKITKESVDMEESKTDNATCDEAEDLVVDKEENKNSLAVQRCHISVLGRSSSENPNPTTKSRRLTDIGRSFSVAHDDSQLPIDSSENLVYDAEEDTSITIPSLNTSPSVLSNKTNSNSQLDKNAVTLRPLEHMRPLREHTVSEGHYSPHVLPKNPLLRDSSFQSDSSHCSSVESLLEARKPDAEAILVNLGFGPGSGSDDVLTRIPKRFLKPSQVRGVDTDSFLKNQQLAMNIHESSVLGYRGLLGNPHQLPSDIVRAIYHRFSQNELQRMASMENISSQRSFKGVANTILAHRQFMK